MIFKKDKCDNLDVQRGMIEKIERAIMQIGKLSLHTTKSAQRNAENTNINNNKLSTNPFGVSFKGNVLQADVFVSDKKEGINIAEKSKLFASAVVSGINSFNESFKSRMNSVVSFGKKVTTNVFDTIERIGNTEITFDMTGIKNRLFPDRQYNVKNLTNRSVDDLKTLWTDLTPAVA